MDDKVKIVDKSIEPVLKTYLKRVDSSDGSIRVIPKVVHKNHLQRSISAKSAASVASKSTKKLSFKTKFFYSMGHIYNDLTVSIWFSYTLLFFKFQFSDSLAGALLLIGQMADAFASPFVGFQSDRMPDLWLFRYLGRRKFWHLLGVILNTLTVPLIYNKPCFPGNCADASNIALFAYYAILIIVFQAGWAATQVSHVSLIVDLTDDTNDRMALNAYRQAATIFANICLYTVTLFVIGFEGNETLNEKDLEVFTTVSYIVCAIGLVFSVLFHVFVKEPAVPEGVGAQEGEWEGKPRGFSSLSTFSMETQRALNQPRMSIIATTVYDTIPSNDGSDTDSTASVESVQHIHTMSQDLEKQLTKHKAPEQQKFYHWLLNVDFWKITIMYTMARMFFNLGQVYTPLYLQYSLRMPKNTIAIMPFATYVAGLMASFGAKPFAARFGSRWVLVIGVVFGVLSCAWIFIGNDSDAYKEWQIYAVSAFLGVGGTALLISTLALTSDLIGTNKATGAFVFAAMSFFDKSVNGVVIELLQHFTPTSSSPTEPIAYYKLILALITGFSSVVTLLGLLAIYRSKYGRITGAKGSAVVMH